MANIQYYDVIQMCIRDRLYYAYDQGICKCIGKTAIQQEETHV